MPTVNHTQLGRKAKFVLLAFRVNKQGLIKSYSEIAHRLMMQTVDEKNKLLKITFIEKDALTSYQSVSVVAVSDVEARYVVCVLLPI